MTIQEMITNRENEIIEKINTEKADIEKANMVTKENNIMKNTLETIAQLYTQLGEAFNKLSEQLNNETNNEDEQIEEVQAIEEPIDFDNLQIDYDSLPVVDPKSVTHIETIVEEQEEKAKAKAIKGSENVDIFISDHSWPTLRGVTAKQEEAANNLRTSYYIALKNDDEVDNKSLEKFMQLEDFGYYWLNVCGIYETAEKRFKTRVNQVKKDIQYFVETCEVPHITDKEKYCR